MITLASLAAPASLATAQETTVAGLRQAAKAAPRDVGAQVALGRALIEAGRLKEDEAVMKRAARLDKGSLPTLFEGMRVKFAEGHYKRVRAACRELAKVDKNHVLTHVCNARALLVWRRASRACAPTPKKPSPPKIPARRRASHAACAPTLPAVANSNGTSSAFAKTNAT